MIERNGKKYYTAEEMLEKGEKHIRKNAEKLVIELRKNNKEFLRKNSGKEVVFS